jgi:HPt (histidine-containing phosphotransfer) domain-containing protein
VLVIEGIDTAQGIEALGGDEELYIDVLAAFCEDVEKWRSVVAAYPETTALKSFITAVHGFKSAARSIGASAAGDFAYGVEKAAKEGELAAVDADRGALLRLMHELLARCKAALGSGG